MSWHIRAGDYFINKGNAAYFETVTAYFETVTSQVVALSGRIPLHIFFIGEDVKVQFPFLESICHNHSTICSFPELESRSTSLYERTDGSVGMFSRSATMREIRYVRLVDQTK